MDTKYYCAICKEKSIPDYESSDRSDDWHPFVPNTGEGKRFLLMKTGKREEYLMERVLKEADKPLEPREVEEALFHYKKLVTHLPHTNLNSIKYYLNKLVKKGKALKFKNGKKTLYSYSEKGASMSIF